MIELISYCIIGGCLVWTIGLVFFLCIESAQDEQELEEIYHQHAMKMKQHAMKLKERQKRINVINITK